MFPRRWSLALALTLLACGDDDDDAAGVDSGLPDAGQDSGADAGLDAGDDAAADAGGPTDDPWCARLAAGAGEDERPFWLALSEAHAGIRFFGPEEEAQTVDLALAAAADGPADDPVDLERYARALPTVCAIQGGADELGDVSVEMRGTVAVVHPGAGAPVLPPGTTAVAVDLRDLPVAPGLGAALEAAVGPALATAVPRPDRVVRQHYGMLDEVFSEDNAYSNDRFTVTRPAIPATGSAELPLAVIVGPTLGPEAAALAVALRVANRAWVLGEPVPMAIVESRWSRIGTGGLAWRAWDVVGASGDRLPDAVPADRADVDVAIGELAGLGAPPPLEQGPNDRLSMGRHYFPESPSPVANGIGELRAALVIAHGATRLFFPYFEVVGDHIDERLTETLAAADEAEAIDRPTIVNLLRRFGEVLHDGHNFVFDDAPFEPGALPLVVDHLDGFPVIVRSLDDDAHPGDTVRAIDGEPVEDLYARELARTSAASDGYRYDIASRRWLASAAARELDLEDPDGAVRTVTIEPVVDEEAFATLGYAPSLRAAGPLDDLGASDVYYINLSSDVLASIEDFRTELTAADGARGLVVDMRGYPGVDHYEVAARLLGEAASSALFRVPVRTAPDQVEIDETSIDVAPQASPSFEGPVALLVGPATVSAAENFSMILVGAERVTVVGRPSAATNGNITGVVLPGSFRFSFTGMEVLFPDRSLFHGVGIVPDVEVAATPADLRDGIDPVLEAARDAL